MHIYLTRGRALLHRASFLTWTTLIVGIYLLLFPLASGIKYQVQKTSQDNPIIQKIIPESIRLPDLSPPTTGTWLIIPSIGVKTSINEGADLSVLDRKMGVWHQTGELGTQNYVIAGHRFKYLPPNTNTFYNLSKIERNDVIIIVREGTVHQFKVTEHKTVSDDSISILDPGTTSALTVYTCVTLTSHDRLVIHAFPI